MSTSTAAPASCASRTSTVSDVVRATALTKRFGEGDAAVDALRGVEVAFAVGSFTAIMGPHGLRQVDAHTSIASRSTAGPSSR